MVSQRVYNAPRWGTCPVCMRERRYTVNGVMVNHRQWISGFECGIKNCTDDHPYGYMKPCQGSGKPPLKNLSGKQIRDLATR